MNNIEVGNQIKNQNTIAKHLHNILSGFRISNGQTPYPSFDNITSQNFELYLWAIDLVEQNPNITPIEIHNLWMEYAKNNIPDHPCIVPFEELTKEEKIKDDLTISVIKLMLKYYE